MKKRRGKRPVKPNIEEAIKDRIVDLKGAQHSSMNIPIVYRRTFGWEGDSVLFRPINKRSFVVQRTGLEEEEMDMEGYVHRELGPKRLPFYFRNRTSGEHEDEYYMEDLRETLISYSLADRYVNIDVTKPKDKDLDTCLRMDLEYLSSELGYNYSITKDAYRCTFVFPKYTNQQTVLRCVQSIQGSLKLLRDFQKKVPKLEVDMGYATLKDISYSVSTSEHNMDRYYTEALNVMWDLPQIETAGHFLIVQGCERVFDEIEYIISCSREVASLLQDKKVQDRMFLWDMFVTLWETSLASAFKTLEKALSTVSSEDPVPDCLDILRQHRLFKVERSSHQVAFVSGLTKRTESAGTGGYKPLVGREYVEVLQHLFGMNQASARIRDLSSILATKVLYLKNSIV